MKMMERKLWFKIFVLLLLALSVLASRDNDDSLVSTVAPEISAAQALTPGIVAAGHKSGSGLGESDPVSASNNNTESVSLTSGFNGTLEEEEIPLILSNGSSTAASSIFLNGNVSEATTSLPLLEKQTLPTQLSTTSPTTLSSTPKNNTTTTPSPLEITNTAQANTSVHIANITPESTSSAVTTTISTTTSSSTTTTTTTTAASTTQKSTPASKTKTTTTTHLNVSNESPVDEATHKAITPSQLNVGEDTTVVHEAPTLDPLLAGLVSAFIIAAVIITLLLYIKLRRRDSRPEFRRLQDLPMDDMMEDTPLSMYSY